VRIKQARVLRLTCKKGLYRIEREHVAAKISLDADFADERR